MVQKGLRTQSRADGESWEAGKRNERGPEGLLGEACGLVWQVVRGECGSVQGGCS